MRRTSLHRSILKQGRDVYAEGKGRGAGPIGENIMTYLGRIAFLTPAKCLSEENAG